VLLHHAPQGVGRVRVDTELDSSDVRPDPLGARCPVEVQRNRAVCPIVAIASAGRTAGLPECNWSSRTWRGTVTHLMLTQMGSGVSAEPAVAPSDSTSSAAAVDSQSPDGSDDSGKEAEAASEPTEAAEPEMTASQEIALYPRGCGFEAHGVFTSHLPSTLDLPDPGRRFAFPRHRGLLEETEVYWR
jgi:hypothetical protein